MSCLRKIFFEYNWNCYFCLNKYVINFVKLVDIHKIFIGKNVHNMYFSDFKMQVSTIIHFWIITTKKT